MGWVLCGQFGVENWLTLFDDSSAGCRAMHVE